MKLLLSLTALLTSAALAADAPFYVGTYTRPGGSKGIHRAVLDTETGSVSALQLVAEANNPSFLAIHPGGKFLYAATEGDTGEASAYVIAADGTLKFLNKQSAKGNGTCHIVTDPAGKNVLVANYGSGSVAVLPIQPDGSLGEATGFDQHTGSSADPGRQKGPHGHAIYVDPAAKFVYSCDLGTDLINGYKFDAARGTITPDPTATGKVAPGSGPRHLALHPKQDTAYVLNEMLSTITAFRRDPASGALTEIHTVSTLPADFSGKNSTAEIFVHPNGKYLYGSNRGHDSLAVYAVGADGRLTTAAIDSSGGRCPRNFALAPGGKFVVVGNQNDDRVCVLPLGRDGREVGAPVTQVSMPQPACHKFIVSPQV